MRRTDFHSSLAGWLIHRVVMIPVLAMFAGLAAGQVMATPPPERGRPSESTAAERSPESRPAEVAADPRYGLLTPVADRGNIPPIVDMLNGRTREALARRALLRGYRKQLQQIKRKHLSTRRSLEVQARGLKELCEFTDPASFQPMIEVLNDAEEVFKLGMLDHFAKRGDHGQGALAWIAMHDHSAALRAEAVSRLVEPVPDQVLRVLDAALRSKQHAVAANAGALAGQMSILQAIPLLISAQVVQGAAPQTGDLAWIAVSKQTVYVQRLEAVAGDSSAAFQPVTGVLTEGFVLRVQDAVVHVYRAAVNHALVAMTSLDYGESTSHLGYDEAAWWEWYNRAYVPFKERQAAIDEMAKPPA